MGGKTGPRSERKGGQDAARESALLSSDLAETRCRKHVAESNDKFRGDPGSAQPASLPESAGLPDPSEAASCRRVSLTTVDQTPCCHRQCKPLDVRTSCGTTSIRGRPYVTIRDLLCLSEGSEQEEGGLSDATEHVVEKRARMHRAFKPHLRHSVPNSRCVQCTGSCPKRCLDAWRSGLEERGIMTSQRLREGPKRDGMAVISGWQLLWSIMKGNSGGPLCAVAGSPDEQNLPYRRVSRRG